MLRTLSLYLANLRARTAEETLDSGEVTAKIRALCDAIEHHGGGVVAQGSASERLQRTDGDVVSPNVER
jgi:hypothetical protein